jgi:hypothetical protein
VNVPLRAGATLESALAALNAQGHHIVYSNALVQPTMTLRVSPRSTRIEELLREILAPWKLRAVQASNGDWLSAADETQAPTSESHRRRPLREHRHHRRHREPRAAGHVGCERDVSGPRRTCSACRISPMTPCACSR